MRIRRTFPIIFAVLVIAAAVTVAVELRKNAPPEAARLLPGGDAFFYVNLGRIRHFAGAKELPAVSHDAEYDAFIRETGFHFERDLDEAAFTIHYPASGGSRTPVSPTPRFSEVFVGKFDATRLASYLKQHATSIDNYESVDIFSIPIEDRTFRVAIIGADSAAASNSDDPAVIRGIVDRSRRLASPFGGPALLRRYYKRVQFASPVWLIAHLDPSSPQFGHWSDLLPSSADIVISAGYNPLHLPLHQAPIHLRAEAFTSSADNARSLGERLNTYLAMFHAAETSAGTSGTDPDVKAAFDSLQIKEEDDRTVLTAVIPPGFFKKLFSETPPGPVPSTPSSAQPPTATKQ